MDFGQLVLVCCFLPSIALLVAGFLIVRNFPRFLKQLPKYTAPDTEELQRQYELLKADNPHDTQSQLVFRIINKYAIRQGIVGALTSVGGAIELPFGLTLDLIYSARSNAAMSYFIAQVYGIEDKEKALNISQLLILRQKPLSPDQLVMYQEQFAGAAYQQLVRSVLIKALAKVIPGAGAFIGFAVNWSSVQMFGRVAEAYYSKNLEKLLGAGVSLVGELANFEKREQLWRGFRDISTSLVDASVVSVSSVVKKLQDRNYDPTADRVTQLERLSELRKIGVLTESEFTSMKQAIIGGLAEKMDQVEAEVLVDDQPPSLSDARLDDLLNPDVTT